jgi:hypothetical protein
MDPLAICTVVFGAILSLIGIFAFFKKGTRGRSRLRFLGVEFEGGPALLIFVVGAILFVVPWIYSDRTNPEPPNDGAVRNDRSTDTASGVEVPLLEGKTLSTATNELARLDLGFEIRRVESQTQGDIILSQDPKAGQNVAPNSQVVISIPDSLVTVPDVKGQALTQAIVALTQKGLKIGEQRSQIEGSGNVGTIIDHVPKANDRVAVGTEVQLTIKGATVTVPRVTEIQWDIARDNVAGAGLKVAAQWDESSSKTNGTVLLQRPTSGSQVAPGSEVLLIVAGKTPSVDFARVRVLSSIRTLPRVMR